MEENVKLIQDNPKYNSIVKKKMQNYSSILNLDLEVIDLLSYPQIKSGQF